MNLNIPDTRQQLLAQRLAHGFQIVAVEAADEFSVSLDTIRRDILALEADGKAHRVRGGAVPITQPASPLSNRLASSDAVKPALIQAALDHIGSAPTVLFDGGTTTLSIVATLPALDGRLVITPSPWIAVACQERGIDVFLLGGKISARGGIAVGETALGKAGSVAADIAILGACGVEAEFGLSSDDYEEAQMKRAMQKAATRTFVVTDGAKIGRRARHHTLPLDQVDLVITDAAPPLTEPLTRAGASVVTA